VIDGLRPEFRAEARRLLLWWVGQMPDDEHGGFRGEIGADDQPVRDAPKSIILNTRLLWFFSAMAAYLKSDEALAMAHRAVAYIRDHFFDPDHGGVYWLLDYKGGVIDGKKQAYAQAFAIYAFCEFYAATGDRSALATAQDLQDLIEARYWDGEYGGYIEALTVDWEPVGKKRL
jgi:mannobiose 2-epimerase